MRIKSKGVKRVIGSLVVAFSILLAFPVTAYGAEDPQEGTASKEIENMIAVGKTLIGKTPYVYGGGHSDWEKQKELDVPTGLDCSSYLAWVLYHGMGIDMGLAPVSGSFGTYFEEVSKGSLDGAQRGDIIFNDGHIEIYLGKDGKGTPYSLHATNERTDVTITETNWGNGMTGKTVVRPSVQDAKAGKNGMSYNAGAIVDKVGNLDTSEEVPATTESNPSSKEDLFTWLNPIVDFSGAIDSHAKSADEGKQIDGNNKGLKGHQKGLLDELFGGM